MSMHVASLVLAGYMFKRPQHIDDDAVCAAHNVGDDDKITIPIQKNTVRSCHRIVSFADAGQGLLDCS